MNPYIIPGLVRNFEQVPASEIVQIVSAFFNIPLPNFFIPNRKRDVVNAKYTAMWLLRHKKFMTFPEIGRHFGVDHSTVMHGVQTVSNLMTVYPYMRHDMDDLIEIIKGTKSLYIKERE